MIKRTPVNDPRKPKYVDRLASLYWQIAGDIQNTAYSEEERCFEKSGKTDADVSRCDRVRDDMAREAEQYREKAIATYKYIVTSFPNFEEIDRILFALAFNYQQKQQNEDAKAIYNELISSYSTSKLLPDALFNMGDIFFCQW
jgi:tetratricopeptide (TPR) repeat protein